MKNYKRLTVCFALFEPIDQWNMSDAVAFFKKKNNTSIKILDGFTYNDYIADHENEINDENYPTDLYSNKIGFRRAHIELEKILLFVVKNKFRSLETRVLLRQLEREVRRLEDVISNISNIIFIIPEDTDAVKGRLVASLAEKHGIQTTVILPFYYDWITTCPLMGDRKANLWILPGVNYRKRLLEQGVKKNNIFIQTPVLLRNRIENVKNKCSGKTKFREPYYLATLQDNDDQEMFVEFLKDAFSGIDDKMVVIKFHPSTSPKVKKILTQKFSSKNVIFIDKADLADLVKNSLGLITISSTSILHALFYNKPVIVVDVGWFFHELYSIIGRTSAFKAVATPMELAGLINKLGSSANLRKYLRKQLPLKNEYFPSRPDTHAGQYKRFMKKIYAE